MSTPPGSAPSAARAERLGHRLAPRTSAGPGGGEAIQAKLTLTKKDDDDEDTYRKTNLADLNRLLAGSNATVGYDDESGLVKFNHGDQVQVDDSHKGYKLLKRMIEHDHEVSIADHNEADNAKNTPDSPDDASDTTKGSGSTVKLAQQTDVSALVKNKDGELVHEQTPRHLVLGHELIHADRAQRGYRSTKSFANSPSYSVQGTYVPDSTKSFGFKLPQGTTHTAKAEESETVGLAQGTDVAPITENDLRGQLGVSKRALYESNVQGFMAENLDDVTEEVRPRDKHLEQPADLFGPMPTREEALRRRAITQRKQRGLKKFGQ